MPTAERVPVEPFRDAFLRSGMSAGEFAKAMGYFRNRRDRRYSTRRAYQTMDTTRGQRVLGIRPQTCGRGYKTFNKTVDIPTAFRLLDLFPSLDPVDVGL